MIKFGDQFPDTYFPSSSTMKKAYIGKADFSNAIETSRTKISTMIDNAGLSAPAIKWCKDCFVKATDEFFYMPVSSTGKYHGGPISTANCVGGNVIHIEDVLRMSDKVLNRYETALGTFYKELSEALKIACILHDISKYKPDSLYTGKYHGEEAADLLKSISTDYDWSGLVAEAVANHMYAWKFQAVWDYIITTRGSVNGVFLSCMLSECDYYSF